MTYNIVQKLFFIVRGSETEETAMYRLQYLDSFGMPCCEWFLTEDDAMENVKELKIEKYRVRFIEFPFKLTRHSVGPMSSASEDTHILQWLNRWADTFRGF